MRRCRFAIAAAGIAAALPVSSSAAAAPRFDPSFRDSGTVTVGDAQTLVADRLGSGLIVSVTAKLAAPGPTGGCCFETLSPEVEVPASHRLSLAWRWPRRFLACRGDECLDEATRGYRKRRTWVNGDRAVVRVRWQTRDGQVLGTRRLGSLTVAVPRNIRSPLAVGVGDSYSAGEGTNVFDPGTDVPGNSCHRSGLSWQRLVASALRAPLLHLACSGAETPDLLTRPFNGELPQLDAVARAGARAPVQLVMLTIGGNDTGFVPVLAKCAVLPLFSCDRSYRRRDGTDVLHERIVQVRGLLGRTYERVNEVAPAARVLVLGYPELFPHPASRCFGPLFGVAEIAYLNEKQDELNATVRDAAEEAGFEFESLGGVFRGHDVCSGRDPWLQSPFRDFGISFKNWFHPNRAGYAAMTGRALDAWRAATIPGADRPPRRLP